MIIYESIFLNRKISNTNKDIIEDDSLNESVKYKDYWINRLYWILTFLFTIIKLIIGFKTNILTILIVLVCPTFRLVLVSIPNMMKFYKRFTNFCVRIIMFIFGKIILISFIGMFY